MKKKAFFLIVFAVLLALTLVFPIAATTPEEESEQRFFDALFSLVGKIMGGVIIGGFCGGAPMTVGFIRKRPVLAILGMISCVIFGVICMVLLNIPAFTSAFCAMIFLALIFLTKKKN